MPSSEPANKEWIINKIKDMNPKTVLDVGTGSGVYADLLSIFVPDAKIYGIEVWQPYINKFNLTSKYYRLANIDVRDLDDFTYDVVIYGDVLEHMSKEDAIKLWEKTSKQAKYAVISVPIIHPPQEAVFGNPYEVHVKEDWTVEEVLETFPGIYAHKTFPITGAFIAKFGD